METTNLIYVLKDPRNDLGVYVGKTTIGVERPIKHVHYSHNEHVRKWVEELRILQLSPKVEILEKDILLDQLSNKELFWISEFTAINQNLFNVALMKEAKSILFFELKTEFLENMDHFLNDLPHFFKSVRWSYKLTQSQLCDYLNINRSTLSLIENGESLQTTLLQKVIKLAISFSKNQSVTINKKQKIRVR